jgi:signal peptidase I
MRSELKDHRGTWSQALKSLLGAVLMILAIRWAFFEPYVIPSGSMIPTLLVHDHILVNKFSYGIHLPFSTTWLLRFSRPRRGDVVVFRSVEDGDVFIIKRVIGLPGERVEVGDEGQVSINGLAVPRRKMSPVEVEEYLAFWSPDERNDLFENYDFYEEILDGRPHVAIQSRGRSGKIQAGIAVGPDQLFMMGDNRDNSSDSRIWGTLPVDRVLGRASLIWMSCEDTLPDANQLCNPQTMRWYRNFKGI